MFSEFACSCLLVCQQTRGGGFCSGQHSTFREVNRPQSKLCGIEPEPKMRQQTEASFGVSKKDKMNSGVSFGAERASSGLEISSLPRHRISSMQAVPDGRRQKRPGKTHFAWHRVGLNCPVSVPEFTWIVIGALSAHSGRRGLPHHAHKGVAAVARAKDSPQVQNFLT